MEGRDTTPTNTEDKGFMESAKETLFEVAEKAKELVHDVKTKIVGVSDQDIATAAQHFEHMKQRLEREEEERKEIERYVEQAEGDMDWNVVHLLKNKVNAMRQNERATELLILKASEKYRRLQHEQVIQKLHEKEPGKCNLAERAIITDLKGNPHSRTQLSEIHGQ